MRRLWTALAVMAAVNWYTLTAMAQSSWELYPTERTVVQTTTAAYTPPGGWGYPAAGSSITASTTWEPAEPATYAPAVNCSPAVNYSPAVSYAPAPGYAPTVSYAPTIAYAPAGGTAPVQPVVYTPVAARYPVQACAAYTPVVARYPAAARVTYAPVANDYLAAAAAAHPGKTVWVHPKVYVKGQPIRNLLRAITP